MFEKVPRKSCGKGTRNSVNTKTFPEDQSTGFFIPWNSCLICVSISVVTGVINVRFGQIIHILYCIFIGDFEISTGWKESKSKAKNNKMLCNRPEVFWKFRKIIWKIRLL